MAEIDVKGAYVSERNGLPSISILNGKGLCGMFLMPNMQDVVWLGFTRYKVEGDKILFSIQNRFDRDGNVIVQGNKQYVNALYVAKDEMYIQNYDLSEDEKTQFNLISKDLSFWEKQGYSIDEIGEARVLGGIVISSEEEGDEKEVRNVKDSDISHEVKEICVGYIKKFGNLFGL